MRKFAVCLILSLCLVLSGFSYASELDDKDYTDVPGTLTQDSVISITTLEGEEIIDCEAPDEKTMTLLTDMFNFVMLENGRPAEYFPDDVRLAMRDVLAGKADIDSLHISELMLIKIHDTSLDSTTIDFSFSVDYSVGQLVLVIIGQFPESGALDEDKPLAEQLTWTPISAKVVSEGVIEFSLSGDLLESVKGGQAVFAVMTNRYNTRTVVESHERIVIVMQEFPSQAAINLTKVEKYTTTTTVPIEDDFEIKVVPESERLTQEIAQMRSFVIEEEKPIFTYFDPAVQDEALLLLPDGTDTSTMIAYEMIALESVNYKDSYGDVEALFSFPTTFPDGTIVLAYIGIPKPGVDEDEDGLDDVEWNVLRCSVSEGYVLVTFSQQALIYMRSEDALLMLVSEKQAIEEAQQQ